MKIAHKLAVLVLVGALLPLALSAKTREESYLETSLKRPGVPVPVAVVSPDNVSADYIGTAVELAFTVDAKGTPTDFAVVSSPDDAIAEVMVEAVKQWRFTPAVKNGAPVATKVVLPLRISSPLENAARFAAN